MMLRRHSAEPCPEGAILIATNDCYCNQHCGIVFTRSCGTVQMCDFQWENRLVVRNVPGSYLWTKVSLDTYEVEQISEFIEFVIEKHRLEPRTPYSFLYTREAFNIAGRLNPGVGLTCATFAIAIFDHFKLSVVDLTSWRERPKQDAAFRRRIVGIMAADPRFSYAARRLAAEPTAFRVKPWELFASASRRLYPVKFRQATKLANAMAKKLYRIRVPTQQFRCCMRQIPKLCHAARL